MIYLAAILLFSLLMLFPVELQNTDSRVAATSAAEISTVTFCDLLKNPLLYDQKMVRTKAIFRRAGEEGAELYCIDCLDVGKVWPDFDESFDSNTKPKIAKNLERERTVSVVVVGKFYGTGNGYGHLNQYKFKFLIMRMEKADIVLNESPIPERVPKKALSKVRCK